MNEQQKVTWTTGRGCNGGNCPGYAKADGGYYVRGRQPTQDERARLGTPGPGENDLFIPDEVINLLKGGA